MIVNLEFIDTIEPVVISTLLELVEFDVSVYICQTTTAEEVDVFSDNDVL